MAWWEYESGGGDAGLDPLKDRLRQKYGGSSGGSQAFDPSLDPLRDRLRQGGAPSMPIAPAQQQVSYAPPGGAGYEERSAPSWYDRIPERYQAMPTANTRMQAQWQAPQWYTDATDWASALMRQSVGRLQAAWEKPEQRTMAPPVQISTIPELRAQQEQQLGQLVSAMPFMEPEQQESMAGYLGQPTLLGLGQKLGPHLEQALQRYESATQEETPLAQAARRVEQVGALGLAALQEPTEIAENIFGSADIARQPEAEGMDPEDWMPLTESAYSILLDSDKGKEIVRLGPVSLKDTGGEWGPLLERVKKGEKAEDIAEEIYNPVLEMVGMTALDPLWVLGMGRKGKELTRVIDDAAGKYATAVDDLEPVARGLDAAMEQGRAVDILTRPAEEAGVFDRLFGKWKDIKRAVNVTELQASSKVSQDLQDLHIVATNAVIDAGSTEEAAARIASWLDNPLMAVEELGQSVASKKGRRVAELLRQLDPEDLITLREGRPFSAEAFGKELLEKAAPILEKEHGVKAWKAAEQLAATVGSEKGKRLKELLRQLDPEDLATLREGRTFTTKQLEKELLQKVMPVLEKEFGIAPLEEYRKFAKTFKNWASEFYLNLNPSYALKNATNNAGTLAYDGILAMDRMPNIEAELQRFGASTARLAGQEAGAIGAFTASKSKLPGVLGKVAQKGRWLASESAIGEEAFVRRGYLAALRKTWNKLWHSGQGIPELPPQLVDAVGPEMADDINRAVAQGVPWEEVQANVQRVMNPQSPGDTLSLVMKYVEPGELESLSPAAWEYLHERIRGARTMEEAQAAIDDVRQTVREMGDLAYRREILEPSRKVFTTVEEVEVVQNLVDDLVADARKFGIAGTEVDDALRGVQQRMEGLRVQLMDGSSAAVKEAGEIGSRDAAEVLYWANRKQQEGVAATRLEVDALRKEAWDLYGAFPHRGAEIWDNYFRRAAQHWEETFTKNLNLWDEARGGLQRLEGGEPLAGIVGMDSRQMNETRIARQVELERKAGRDLAEVKGFQARLNVLRARVDLAQENAQRVGFQIPDRESLDILDDADRFTQDLARKWRVESDALRGQYRGANKAQRKQIAEAQDELAQKLFGDQEAKWQAAERDLRARMGAVGDVVAPPVEGGPVGAAEAVEAAAPTRTFSGAELTERIKGLLADVNFAAGESHFKHRTHLMNALKRKLGKDFKWPHPDDEAEWNRLAELAGDYAGGDKAAVAGLVDEAAEAIGEQWAKTMVEKFGLTDDPNKAGWILSDGRMIDLSRGREGQAVAHQVSLRNALGSAWEGDEAVVLRKFMDETGAVRIAKGDVFEAVVPVSSAQRRIIGDVVDSGRDVWYDLFGDFGHRSGVIRNKVEFGRFNQLATGKVAKSTVADARAVPGATERPGLVDEAVEAPAEFAQWFKGSKIVDDAGKPQTVYHGTLADFTEFALPEGEAGTLDRMLGIHFAADSDVASRFALGIHARGEKYGGRVIPAYLSIKNPKILKPMKGVFDQELLAREVLDTVLTENKGLFAKWMNKRGAPITSEQIDTIYDLLKQGEEITDDVAGSLWSLRKEYVDERGFVYGPGAYVANWDTGLNLAPELRQQVVTEYKGILKSQGYDGLIYQNTSPMETGAVSLKLPGAADFPAESDFARVSEVADKTSYIALEAEQVKPALLHKTAAEKVAAARALPNATERPGLVDLTKITEPRQLAALDAIEQGIVRDWPQWQQRTSNIWQQRVVDAWLGEAVRPAWRDARLVAAQGADSLMKRSLLDYTQQNRIDGFLDLIYPYHYWYTRTGVNWMRRMANNPAVLGTYIRYKQTMKDLNEQRGLRSRFEGKWRVKLPDGVLPEWTDRYYYFDPVQALFPFSQWDRTDWDDDEEANGALTTIYQESKKFGMRPYAFIEVPLQYANQLGESREEIGNLIPLTAHVKGATALAGVGPAGGVNIEAPIRKLAGLQEQAPWDPYRVTRQLGSMSGDEPELYDTALKAEQLQLAVKEGELELRDATGESGEVSRALVSIQEEYGWSDEELAEAQELLREALHRAGVERGIASVGSIATGMPSSVLATGEQTQKALQEEAKEKAWRLDNPEGSREEYTQFKLDHPEIYAREAQYSTIQGETQQEGLSPAARANWLKLKAAKDKLYESYQKKIDAHLREKPWDGKGVSAIKKERKAAIEEIEAKYPMPEMEGDIPAILYGMNPPEMWDSVVDDALRDLKEQGPQVEDYTNKKEEVDWSKYYDDLDAWEAKLPPEVPGVGAIKVGTYEGMDTLTALDNFNQRHDSPLQAAHNVYQQVVASPTYDQYGELDAAEEAKYPGMKALQKQYWALDKGARKSFLAENPGLKDYLDYKDTRGASPYDRTVGSVVPVKAVDLIPWIQQQYQARGWTEQELMRELEGVVFKPLGKQKPKAKADKEQETSKESGSNGSSDYRIPHDIYQQMQEDKAGRPWRQVYGKPWYEKELPKWAPPQR